MMWRDDADVVLARKPFTFSTYASEGHLERLCRNEQPSEGSNFYDERLIIFVL